MNQSVAHNNKSAIESVKSRFVRVPSANTYPRFKDLITGIDQADADILAHYYRKNGGVNQDHHSNYLLGCLPWLYGETFAPNGPQFINDCLNLWQPSDIKPSGNKVAAAEVAPFLEFVSRWFPVEEERIYFLWWLAWTIRKPEERLTATPLLRSEHGTGKGFFAECLMSGLMHKTSVALTSLKDVVGDFNDVIEGKTLIIIDEVYKSKKSTTDSLKSVQGNKTLALRRKHKPVVVVDNYINFIITSNDHIPLTLEQGDRRFWVPQFLRHRESLQETESFINDNLKPWLLKGGFQLVRDYLEQGDLNRFRPSHAPMTASKQEILGFTTEDRLSDTLSAFLGAEKVVTLKQLKLQFSEDLHNLSDATIASTLVGLGCQQKRTNSGRYYITEYGIECGLSTSSTPKDLESNVNNDRF